MVLESGSRVSHPFSLANALRHDFVPVGFLPLYCNASQSEISGSGCIEGLAGFNKSLDTIPVTPAPFDSPGPADPSGCLTANGMVIGMGYG